MAHSLSLVATCALGLEDLLAAEISQLGAEGRKQRGAVNFGGSWEDVWRANWRLRTANRILVELHRWSAPDGDSLAAGAQALVEATSRSWSGLTGRELFDPQRTLALRATSSSSSVRDVRWVALRVKDGVVDGQRRIYGKRSSIDRRNPDLRLRVWLHRDVAALLLDTSGEPLDRRGYRLDTAEAPVREHIAAACILASGWSGHGPVVDPMCGAGTLLAEAAAIAMGLPPGRHRRGGWAFERLPIHDADQWAKVREEGLSAAQPHPGLFGVDRDPAAVEAARANLARAGLMDHAQLVVGDGFEFVPPPGPGLVVVNPPYGERVHGDPGQWRRLGDLLKQRYTGWKAVVLAGGADRGKHIGLRPSFRMPVRNGPLDARILGFDLY